jgi:hypothetical protein
MTTDIYSIRYPVIVDNLAAFPPRFEPCQVRFPRSKRSRIRKKWAKDRRNWRSVQVIEPEAAIVDFPDRGASPVHDAGRSLSHFIVLNSAAAEWFKNSAGPLILGSPRNYQTPATCELPATTDELQDRVLAVMRRVKPPEPWNGIEVPDTLFRFEDRSDPERETFPMIDFRSSVTMRPTMGPIGLIRGSFE